LRGGSFRRTKKNFTKKREVASLITCKKTRLRKIPWKENRGAFKDSDSGSREGTEKVPERYFRGKGHVAFGMMRERNRVEGTLEK